MSPVSELLTPTELAELLKISPGTVSNWRTRRQGPPYFHIEQQVRYPLADVLAWLEANRVTPTR